MLVYLTPWCRAGPVVVGVVLGYVLHRQRGKHVPMGRVREMETGYLYADRYLKSIVKYYLLYIPVL